MDAVLESWTVLDHRWLELTDSSGTLKIID